MPRRARIDTPGLIYHIMGRGIERGSIFREDADRSFFLNKLGELVIDTDTPLYTFALLDNHFHLMMRREKLSLSTFMQKLLTSYAIYFNKKYGRTGHLFENRFKDKICHDERYCRQLVRYINLNPLQGNRVSMSFLSSFRYGGHRYLVGAGRRSWFDPRLALSFFGSGTAAISLYQELMDQEIEQIDEQASREPRPFAVTAKRPPATKSSALTQSAFLPHDLSEAGISSQRLQRPAISIAGTRTDSAIEQIFISIAEDLDVSISEIMNGVRTRRVSRARMILAYRLSRKAGLKQSEIAQRLGVSAAAITKMISRAEEAMRPVADGWSPVRRP